MGTKPSMYKTSHAECLGYQRNIHVKYIYKNIRLEL